MAKKKILIVEDDQMNREYLSQLLEDDYIVVGVATGEEALEILDETAPDLIIVDLGLPGVDGCELTRRLRHSPKWLRTPIIAVTGHVRAGDTESATLAGCSDCLAKPIHDETLLALLARHLGQDGGDGD